MFGFFSDLHWLKFSNTIVCLHIPTVPGLSVTACVCMSLRATVAVYQGSEAEMENSQPLRELAIFAEW